MRGIAFVSAVFALFSVPGMSMAENKNYFSAQLGGAFPTSKLSHQTSNAGIVDKSLKSTVIYDLAIAREVYTNTFLELELSYANHKFDSSYSEPTHTANFSSKVSSTNVFANLNYRFKELGTPFIPYILAGIGVSSNRTKDIIQSEPDVSISRTANSKTKTNFAWQIGAGFLVPISETIDMNFSYKYRDLGKIDSPSTMLRNNGTTDQFDSSVLKGRLRTSNILVGVSFNF